MGNEGDPEEVERVWGGGLWNRAVREEAFQKPRYECILRRVANHQSYRARHQQQDVARDDLPLRRVRTQRGEEVAVKETHKSGQNGAGCALEM